MPRLLKLVAAAFVATLLAPAVPAIAKLNVVASFSIVADIVGRVGGDRIELIPLVGPGGDAHVFSPSPRDIAKVAAADLFVVNGLGFEGWIERIVEASGTKAKVVFAAERVPAVRSDPDQRGGIDPHAWQSAANVVLYVVTVERALCAADPAGCAEYASNAAAYSNELTALDAEVRRVIATIPAAKRKVITSHDAFGYFAATYGIEFLAPEGVSTESEATAADVAKLIRQIRKEAVTAVFVESISDKRLIERIGQDTGAAIGGTLYSDALSPAGGPAATYLDMMRHNARTLAAALAGGP